MPIVKSGNTVIESEMTDLRQFLRTGVIKAADLSVCDDQDHLKQLKFDCSALTTNTSVTLKPQATTSGTFSLPGQASGTLGLANSLQYAAPTTGQTVTVLATNNILILEPAGTLNDLTIALPTAPTNAYMLSIAAVKPITNLTVTAGGSDTIVSGLPGSFLTDDFLVLTYRASTSKWYKIGFNA